MEGDNALIPCELTAENSSYIKDFILIWKAIKNASTSVLASFNKTSGITRFFEKRLSLDTAKPYHLHINGLTLHDQGDYLCNVSTPQYTQLTITTLQVGKLTRFLHGRTEEEKDQLKSMGSQGKFSQESFKRYREESVLCLH